MKKHLMTLAAALCCVMVLSMFTACEKDKDKHLYTIVVEPGGLLFGSEAVAWRDAVMKIYQHELGTDSDKFSKNGTQEECDKEVLDACKRAQMSLNIGGAGKVEVQNIKAKKTVYRYIIQ